MNHDRLPTDGQIPVSVLMMILGREGMILRSPNFVTATGTFVDAPERGAGSGFIRGIEHRTAAVGEVCLPLV